MFEQIKEFLDVRELATQAVEFLPSLIAAIVIVVLAYIFYRITRKLLVSALRKVSFQETLIKLLIENVYRYAIMITGAIMAVDQMGIDVTTALAGVGVIGIAVGFAAQDAVGNVIAGILIFWDQPFKVGDWIETEDQYGQVSDITLRTTRIKTKRNTYVVIPNKRIIDEVLENYTKHGELRIDVPVGIAYKEDISRAREVLLNDIVSIDVVLDSPAPDVVVNELGGSSVNMLVRVWIDNADHRMPTYFEVLEHCKIKLDEAAIEIPFPHLQLHLDAVNEGIWKAGQSLVNAQT